jgi:septation ring formation regulator EzrA
MSQNNLPNSLPSIERLLQRISVAEKSQQKEIRISIQEARELTADLALLTSKLGKTVQEINETLKSIKDSTQTIDIKFDGGTF